MTRPDPFAGQPHHALRPWTDLPPDGPAPTPRPPVTVGPLNVDGLRELLGRSITDLFNGGVYFCATCAGILDNYGDGRRCQGHREVAA